MISDKKLNTKYQYLCELEELSEDILERRISFNETDVFGLQALSFLSKQVEHIKSIKVLVASNLGRDAMLIARSMLEGSSRLMWTSYEKEERSLRWRAYVFLEKNKELCALVGTPLYNKDEHDKIIRKIMENKELLYNKESKKQRENSLFKNKYGIRDWSNKSIRNVMKEIGGEELYNVIYTYTSRWIHWTPGGILTSLNRDENEYNYKAPDTSNLSTATACAFQSIYHTLLITCAHFEIEDIDRIYDIRDRYIASEGIK